MASVEQRIRESRCTICGGPQFGPHGEGCPRAETPTNLADALLERFDVGLYVMIERNMATGWASVRGLFTSLDNAEAWGNEYVGATLAWHRHADYGTMADNGGAWLYKVTRWVIEDGMP